ncbi:MAG TPA: hypothetical protein VN852_04480 [Candidatus Krumholzibacteria bacterium]|nr:hypothetical protein [Candidatus Krumholzibacteria bacterium]
MAPVAFGVLATIATVIVVAILVGAVGGAVTGRLRSDLVLGAAVSAVVHFVIVAAIKSSWSSGKIAVFRLLPLMITFVIASVATRFFLTRVRPVLAVLFGVGIALLAGGLYLTLIKLEWVPLAAPRTAWVAAGIFAVLMALSLRRRMRILHNGK